MTAIKLLALPPHFKEKSNFEAIKLAMPLTFGFIAGCATTMLLYNYMYHCETFWLRILSIPLIFISTMYTGYQFSDFASFAHDGGHGTLYSKLSVSFFLGVLLSSVIPGFMGVAYNQTHFPHHRYCNTEKDLQAVWYSSSKIVRLPRLIAMFAFGVLTYYYYFLDAVSYVTGKSKVPNLSHRQSKVFAIINMILNLAAVIASCMLYKLSPEWFTLCFFVPWLWTFVFFTHFVYTDHGDTGLGYQNSRTLTHPLVRLLMNGNNYHLEHHLYPHVRRTKLHELHLFLKSAGFFAANNCIIDDNFWHMITIPYKTNQPLFENDEKSSAA